MTIGTPVQLLAAANVASAGHNTTGADAPAGSLIVVFIATWNGLDGTVTAVSDSAGNTYTLAVQPAAGASMPYPGAIYYCSNSANDLPSGGWISATSSGGDNFTIGAWAVSGANGGLDATASTSDNNSTVSLSTGTLGSASEIVFGGIGTRANLGTLTDPGAFTELFFSATSAHQPFAYDIVSSNSSVTYDPSWSNTAAFVAVLASFKATGGAPTVKPLPPFDFRVI